MRFVCMTVCDKLTISFGSLSLMLFGFFLSLSLSLTSLFTENQFIFTAKHIYTAATSRYWYMAWDGIRTCNAWLLPNFMNNFRNSTMRLSKRFLYGCVCIRLRFKQTMDLLIAKAKSFLAFKQIILYMYLPRANERMCIGSHGIQQ